MLQWLGDTPSGGPPNVRGLGLAEVMSAAKWLSHASVLATRGVP